MRKNRSYIPLIIALFLLGAVAGCGSTAGAGDGTDPVDQEENQGDLEAGNEESDQDETGSQGNGAMIQGNAQETKELAAELSQDWMNMEFVFDGHKYQLPQSYRELESSGWSLDLKAYGYTDGYQMNPGDMTYETLELENDTYDEGLLCTVGFVNNGTEAADILDCDIWSFSFDTCYGYEPLDHIPAMAIAGGIALGSSQEDVITAFGEPVEIYSSQEDGYATLDYLVDSTYGLSITVFDDYGVTAIELSNHQ